MAAKGKKPAGAGGGLVGVGACVQDAFELVGERASLKNRIWDVRTGFSELDRMLGGIESGDLVLAVAGPGEGKTSLALNVAVNAAKARARVLVFAPQENATRIGLRLLAPEARVPLQKLRRGRISEEDRIRVADAADRLAKLDITVSCEVIPTLDSLSDAVRGWRTKGEALVVVDGLDLLAMGFVDGGRWPPDVSGAALGLKNVALQRGVAVFATCGSAALGDPARFKYPAVRDIAFRGLGCVGAVADAVLCLDWYSDGLSVDAVALKGRMGGSPRARLAFVGEYARFMDRADDPLQDGLCFAQDTGWLLDGRGLATIEPSGEELLARSFYVSRVRCGLKSTLGMARRYVADKLSGRPSALVESWDAEADGPGPWRWGVVGCEMGFELSTVAFSDCGPYRRLMAGMGERDCGVGCVVIAREGRIVLLVDQAVGSDATPSAFAPSADDFAPVTSLIDRDDPGDLTMAWTAFQVWAGKAGHAHDPARFRAIARVLANLEG